MTFIDICAGIGGFRAGLEKAGLKCIGYVEIDKYARRSYEAMYDTSNEWTALDVQEIRSEEIPRADLWCFGFPCQDISIAGRREGLGGERSGIFYSIIKLLKSKDPEDRPEWLLIENVKNLLSINGGRDFTEVLSEISEAGYDCEWEVFNSKDYGVPQNRERVYIIGHLREKGRREVLFRSNETRQSNREGQIKTLVKSTQHFSVVDSEGICPTISACDYKDPQKVAVLLHGKHETEDIISDKGVCKTLKATDYKNPHKVAIPKNEIKLRQIVRGSQAYRVYDSHGLGRTISGGAGGLGARTGYYAVPKEELSNHGVMICEGAEYNVRKLTPRECFRLQGFTDEQYEKAEPFNSDTQLYKQAGNAVTVNVVEMIGRKICEATT